MPEPIDPERRFEPSTLFGKAFAHLSRSAAPSSPLPPQAEDRSANHPTQAPAPGIAAHRGHHIIHGVAGSGKTTQLCAHAVQLAAMQAQSPHPRPILLLCYNEPLALWLQHEMRQRDLTGQVLALHFHRWCREQLVAYHLELPPRHMPAAEQIKNVVQRVTSALADGAIPAGQYAAVLVDEAHDFLPDWLAMLTQLPEPGNNHLVLSFDDAQSIYRRRRTRHIRLDGLGIAPANIRRLTGNQRNSAPIFNAALRMAGDLLEPEERGEHGIPRLKPASDRQGGAAVQIFWMDHLREQGQQTARLLRQAHAKGMAWGDMAVLCRNRFQMDVCHGALQQLGIPQQLRHGAGEFDPAQDTVKIMSLQASAGLAFGLVVIIDSAELPSTESEMEEKQRLLYIGATRARHKLCLVGLKRQAG
ncbi:hypothetical protein D8I35_13005 [Corticibacter populi]|uniref:DNA 3'-5' helicase II n=1 Tax=Corticibacter populi TaxID=1550736 RepID=A0A3M6QQQ3_9BURK|nr:3'-5' exonuclease [Corticibacter populi]RMX04782.1 hypothetical protein D8I35_13005 [Corticibacter populi]RZS33806.1 UvrD-like helicase family protein [Corticibacter populi]